MKLRQFILAYYAVLFILFGLAGLLFPEEMAHLLHIGLTKPLAKMEYIATYGGLFTGLALFMFYCLHSNVITGLVCVLLTMGGMFVSRMIGYFLYGDIDIVQIIYLAGELFTIVLISVLLLKDRAYSQPTA